MTRDSFPLLGNGAHTSLTDLQTPLQSSELTALDWIGVVIASIGAIFCFQFPLEARTFAKMLADFGGELPLITRLGLSIWFPILLGLVPLGVLVPAVGPWLALSVRRGLIVGAFAVSLMCCGVCLYAVYAPIFAIAEALK